MAVPAPTNLTAVKVDPTHIKLTWQGPSTVTPELWGANLIATLPVGSHESTRGPLQPGPYTYRLRFKQGTEYSPYASFPAVTINPTVAEVVAQLAALQAQWEEAQRLILMHQGFDNQHAASLRVIADKLTTP